MPLTTHGIAIQILASIQAHRDHRERCTTNDCKVVVNHLIRKFSEPLAKQNAEQRLVSKQVATGVSDDTLQEHAVPVIVLVEKLLEMADARLEITESNVKSVEDFLRQSLLIVEVTRGEDLRLSACGFQRSMPRGWNDADDPLYLDPLARYKEAGIEV